MDKYEYKVRADEIKNLIAQGDFIQAAEIADTIDWRRVKSVMMLCTISDVYKINRRYEDARDMLLLAYERRPGGRTICYSLCELSIKMEEYVQAVEYYKEFVQVAPKDSGRYILQYRLYEAQDVSLEERIEVLEELKKRDYREKWAYELAYLYHRVGLATRCVEECDEMILWFGEGKYVVKAMELKMLHEPLTPAQQEKYDNRFKRMEEELPVEAAPEVEEAAEANPENTVEETFDVGGDTKIYEVIRPHQLRPYQEQQPEPEEEVVQPEEMEIHVNVDQYNTMNLQAELAEGLKEVLGEEKGLNRIHNPITRSIVAPMLESDTESLDYPQIEEVSEDDLELTSEEIEDSEVFFGETGEISRSLQMEVQEPIEKLQHEIVPDITAGIVMEQMRQEETGEGEAPVWNAEPPKELAGVLSQESDGQLSLVMPESENIEKQITGQMSIEDILAEWERMKKENEEKRKEEVRQHVLQHTGAMFTEFEAAVRDGLLEQLEKDAAEKKAAENNIKPTVEAVEEQVEKVADSSLEQTEQETTTVESIEEAIQAEADASEEIALEETEAEETEDIVWDVEEPTEETEDFVEEVQETFVSEVEQENIPEAAPTEEAAEELSQEATMVEEEPHEKATAKEDAPVEREKAKVRMLTREERELFAPFVQSRSAREQLVQAIDNISMASYTGNIIITGEEGMDTLTLAKNMIREVQLTDSNFSGKVAKISGKALNKKDVYPIVENLKNGALIIQGASDLNADTVGSLNKILQQENMGIIVVLVDNKRAMNFFLDDYKEFHSCFTARMDVEALSNDTLVAFGRQYAKEMEYAIDEMGVLALHTRIEELQTSDHIVTVMEVKEIVDEAIYHVNRKTLGHFFDVLFARRYDEEDMIILSEKDFV